MTFKWTYIAAAILAVVGIGVSLLGDGGLLGAATHIYAITLIGAGGVLVLLSRLVKPRPPVDGHKAPFVSYPNHQVLAVIDDPHAAVDAIRELRHNGLTGKVSVYRGPEGAASIDSEGTMHGLTGVTERSVEHLMADLDDMANYDAAVRAGKVVLGFDGSDPVKRREGADILKAHGGHNIQYFGGMVVEVLDVDRSRTRV